MQHLFVFKCLVSTSTEHLLNKVLLSGKFYLFVSEVYLRWINSGSELKKKKSFVMQTRLLKDGANMKKLV